MTWVLSRPAGLLVLPLLMALGAVLLLGTRDDAPVSNAQQARAIASELRCPVCKDLSAADSPAPLARQMRQQISTQLDAGVPPSQIRQRFVDAYGPSVLLTPPDRGWGRLARLIPLLVVGGTGTAGAVVLRRALRKGVAP